MKFTAAKLGNGVGAGALAADVDGDGKPDLLVWSAAGIQLYKGGAAPAAECGLGAVKDVVECRGRAITTTMACPIWP